MHRVFRSKLLLPAAADYLPRPRLTGSCRPPRLTLLQAPTGAGKTVFLAQWLPCLAIPSVYYRLDERDVDGGVFAAHVAAGFRALWADWAPPLAALADPLELAAELAGEAGARPPAVLALDGLDAAFGRPWLADFLAMLDRYAPPALHLVLSTRAPLPVELGADAICLRAADLAFSFDEAEAWLGAGDWGECFALGGGLPLALEMWRQHGAAGWRGALTARVLAGLPSYVVPEIGAALVGEWLAGKLSLEAFAHHVAVGQPGAEQVHLEIQGLHMLLVDHPPAARERATALWETARGRGDRPLMAAVAMLQAEIEMNLGDYALASEWFRQAFEIDPMLELTGAHSKALLLRDQGRLEEAEALAQRCLAARAGRGDLTAMAMGHLTYGMVLLARARLDEAEAHLLEAEQYYRKYAANVPVAATAVCQRALVEAARGNMPAFRQLADEAHAMVRGQFRLLEACTGMVLASALLAWGDRVSSERLIGNAFAYFSSIGAKFWLHTLLTIFARKAWGEGRFDEARRSFDQALAYAAAEGFVHYLTSPRMDALGLIADALARGVEAPFCQELLARMGARALPALLEMARSPEAGTRWAALYPLAATGGEEATAAIRGLLHDSDQAVRDGALLAYQSLVRAGAPGAAPGPGPGVAAPSPAPGPAPALLSVAVLGPLVVTLAEAPLSKWRTVKARDLLAFFVLSGDRPVTRDQVLEALWPDADLESARTLLHTTLYNLRGTLGATGEGLITFAGGAYRMAREGVHSDLDRFQRLAAAADEASWRAAAALYRGDLLEGLDYPWCEAPRTHARRLYQATVRKLADRAGAAGRHDEAVEFLQLLIQVDPLDEEAHLGLMEAYAALGHRSSALQQYRTIARLLDEELGLEPGARTQALYRRLLD
ncbi:MAG TPA: BTAD domain-containing putative transcriptional regulator [Symbiobacteriaceae bacterium]|nr:BTAD domain-containing putative transcriptional regulator [Symbiobacteriaceae bacterium]